MEQTTKKHEVTSRGNHLIDPTGPMDQDSVVKELRELIVEAAPERALAEPVRHCADDEPLDSLIPFSSVIVLGVIVAVEDRFHISVTRESLTQASHGGVTLRKLAAMVLEIRRNMRAGVAT